MNQKDVERAIEIMQYNLDDPILFKGENVTKAIETAIACMELQVRKKPTSKDITNQCCSCGITVSREKNIKHCDLCGQRILWGAER